MRCQVIFDFVKRENGGMPFDPMIVALPGVTVEVYHAGTGVSCRLHTPIDSYASRNAYLKSCVPSCSAKMARYWLGVGKTTARKDIVSHPKHRRRQITSVLNQAHLR